MTDFAELLSISLYFHICCTLKHTLFKLELLNQSVERSLIDFHYELFEIITEMYFPLPNYALLSIKNFYHVVDCL